MVATRLVLRGARCRPRADLAVTLNTSTHDGTDPRSMETVLRQHGLSVLSGEMHADDLAYLTGRGAPVACLIQLQGVGHWVVVASADGRLVRYQDPAQGPKALTWRKWLSVWRDVDRLGAIYRQWGISAWR